MLTLFAGSIKLAIQGFKPQEGTAALTVYGKTPIGSDLKEADRFFQEKEQQIRAELAQSDVFDFFSSQI